MQIIPLITLAELSGLTVRIEEITAEDHALFSQKAKTTGTLEAIGDLGITEEDGKWYLLEVER